MTHVEPSFRCLFKRGGYFRTGTRKVREIKQAERFVVSALSFCLRHNPQFARRFAEEVFGFVGLPSNGTTEFRFLVEPFRPGPDLFLMEDKSKFVGVIEAKIWTELKEHQDFREPRWAIDGYGHQIATEPTFHGDSKIYYLVLDGKVDATNPERVEVAGRKIWCLSRSWSYLMPLLNGGGLLADFRECLAHFGVSTFSLEKLQDMKMKHDISNGAKAYGLIQGVYDALGFQRDRLEQDIGWESSENWWLGADVRKPSQVQHIKGAHGKLKKLVNGGEDALAWFGYESSGPRTLDLSVYLYCPTVAHAEKIKSKLWQRLTPYRLSIIEDYASLRIAESASAANQERDDKDWFIGVFKALKIVPPEFAR